MAAMKEKTHKTDKQHIKISLYYLSKSTEKERKKKERTVERKVNLAKHKGHNVLKHTRLWQ